ncbi:uncharacterized protein F4807DRAFT_462538 [Annulohypoxylon truncatum]|uniref:uncharacterized protein n=1 Tax=Annulohypoxylon truncatum TaxID=327061 RepID=UPI00200813FD|nr:uncharacterized protein F4807DRAFT_462538 [Annulohypoxylon truncatum]KAI1207738.1 hypothetical protein F4807DRAFT_462538 [Annulohypoxylon truncatum]
MAPQEALSLLGAPKTFHQFPELAQEIQIMVWREFILDANKDRVIILDEISREILPTPFLECSTFCVNLLSRQVFLNLYPVQIPVHKTRLQLFLANNIEFIRDGTLDELYDDDYATGTRGEPHGCVYVNFDRDIFAMTGFNRLFDSLYKTQIENIYKYKTLALDLGQCKLVKHLMEYWVGGEEIVDGILVVDKFVGHAYKEMVFSEVETCRHVDPDLTFDLDYFDDPYEPEKFLGHLMGLPGCELFKKWKPTHHLVHKEHAIKAQGATEAKA